MGLGNTILSDDGVGVYAARHARGLLEPSDAIDVQEAEIGGFGLLDLLEGYRACVILDASLSPDLEPGEIRRLGPEASRPSARLVMGHQVDLPTALGLGRALHRHMPEEVVILAVGVAEPLLLGESCTAPVAAAIEPAARLAVALAREL